MKGFHRHLNTKSDYEYIKAHEPDNVWKPAWASLIETKNSWLELGDDESADDYPADCVREVTDIDEADGTEKKVTQVFREDRNCKLFRLGFSVAEVEAALAE